jgi:hypothetical protein
MRGGSSHAAAEGRPLPPFQLAVPHGLDGFACPLRLLNGSGFLALLPPCPLLEQCVASVGQVLELAVLDAHQPVAEAAADASIDGVDPERLPVEERAHLNAELP